MLPRLHELYLLLLERTGGAAVLTRGGIPAEALAIAIVTAVLLLYAALAAGRDPWVRAFRAFALLAAFALAGAVLAAGIGPELTGAALLALLVSAPAHRALRRRRAASGAGRAIERLRVALEVAGLALLGASAALWLWGRPVPLNLAFWAVFLVRLSIAELLDPSRMAEETGLRKSALADVKSAVRRKRLGRAARGLGKLVLLGLWLALPVLSAISRDEVARSQWPRAAMLLGGYPAVALALSSVVLLARVPRLLPREPLEAGRSLLAALATAGYLALVLGDPAFARYRASLSGIVLMEAVAGFLFVAASRRRR